MFFFLSICYSIDVQKDGVLPELLVRGLLPLFLVRILSVDLYLQSEIRILFLFIFLCLISYKVFSPLISVEIFGMLWA